MGRRSHPSGRPYLCLFVIILHSAAGGHGIQAVSTRVIIYFAV